MSQVVAASSQERTLAKLLVFIGLMLLILIPRLSQLDALATSDEQLWVARSANFYEALTIGDLADTYQFVHPGVPVMWAGAFGIWLHVPELAESAGGQIGIRGRAMPELLHSIGYSKIEFLVELRQVLIIVSAIVLFGGFLILSRLVGFVQAAVAIAFVSLDPMHIGLTRLLHVDGLSTNLLLLSVLAFSLHLNEGSRRALAISAIAGGFACLTRSANAALIPILAFISFIDFMSATEITVRRFIRSVGPIARKIAIWSAIALATFSAAWPAMWVAPAGTMRKMFVGGAELAAEPHARQMFFLGRMLLVDPGLLYYPVVLVYRVSAITILGLVVVIVALLRPRDIGKELPRRVVQHLFLFSFSYLILLSIAPKKIDRYLLPVVVMLDLIAALGLISFAIWISNGFLRRVKRFSQLAFPACCLILLISQAGFAAQSSPVFIDEANPLIGGTNGGRAAFSSNLGEGGKEIAESLMTIDNVEQLDIVTGLWPQTVDIYLPFATKAAIYTYDLEGAGQWLSTDLLVVSFPEIQRGFYTQDYLNWFNSHEPIRTVYDDHGVYARIYDIRGKPLPNFLTEFNGTPLGFGPGTHLNGVILPKLVAQGEGAKVQLYFQQQGPPANLEMTIDVVDRHGQSVSTTRKTEYFNPTDVTTVVTLIVDTPIDAKPGRYTIQLSIRDVSSGLVLTLVPMSTSDPLSSVVPVGTYRIERLSDAQEYVGFTPSADAIPVPDDR